MKFFSTNSHFTMETTVFWSLYKPKSLTEISRFHCNWISQQKFQIFNSQNNEKIPEKSFSNFSPNSNQQFPKTIPEPISFHVYTVFVTRKHKLTQPHVNKLELDSCLSCSRKFRCHEMIFLFLWLFSLYSLRASRELRRKRRRNCLC